MAQDGKPAGDAGMGSDARGTPDLTRVAPYVPTHEELTRLSHCFVYHPPHCDAQRQRYETVRGNCYRAAESLLFLCPPSAERTLAFRKLEEAMMWANASIAREVHNHAAKPSA